LVGATFADTCFFTNSGTEACELAVKMSRRFWHDQGAPERHVILAFTGSFHGRSSAGIAAAGSEKMTKGFGPLLPGFRHLPFGDHDALHAAMAEPDVAAVILEPVQGEGGIVPVPDVCLRGLRALCDETGALMILDEVQCGMGRTGRLFAHEWAGIAPDIMMVAKGIGGGFPLGAVLATEAAAACMTAGTHGSTYGGNPLACAVGNAVMEIVANDTFLADVRRKAGQFRQGLEGLVASHPDVFEAVRGSGLMLGLKCRVPNGDVVTAAYAHGVCVIPGGDNVIRILPGLNIEDDDIREGLARLDRIALTLGSGADIASRHQAVT
jgi:acetylornithine/N-succinyldiaminopimelate aminotransferase